MRNLLYYAIFTLLSSSLQIQIPLTLTSISNHANYIRYSGMLKSVDYKLLTGEFFLGTPKQQLNLLLDTTSSVSWIPKSNMHNFSMHTFDPSRSSTFSTFGTNHSASYEDLLQQGELSADVLDFTTEKRNKNLPPTFHFVLVDSTEEPDSHITGFDGTMSLLRHDNVKNAKHGRHNETISLPEYLAQHNIVHDNKFAIEFLPNNHSMLYIDEEDLVKQIMLHKNNSFGSCSFDREFNHNWHCVVKYVNVVSGNGSRIEKRVDLLGNEYAIIDSSQPYIVAPKKSGLTVLEYYRDLFKQCTMYSKYEMYTFLVCQGNSFHMEQVPQLCIGLGNKDICIEKDDLFYVGYDELTKKQLHVFKLIVFEFDDDEWKLGLPIFYKRMVMFDNELNQITFVDVNEVNDSAHDYQRRKFIFKKEEEIKYMKSICLYIIVLSCVMIVCMCCMKSDMRFHKKNETYHKERILNNDNESHARELKEIII